MKEFFEKINMEALLDMLDRENLIEMNGTEATLTFLLQILVIVLGLVLVLALIALVIFIIALNVYLNGAL